MQDPISGTKRCCVPEVIYLGSRSRLEEKALRRWIVEYFVLLVCSTLLGPLVIVGYSLVHKWELTGYYPVFTVVMAIYHYVEIIWRILVNPNFCTTFIIMNKYYPDEPVNIHIQSLLNIIQDKNRVITT